MGEGQGVGGGSDFTGGGARGQRQTQEVEDLEKQSAA
jgi:hypothetical protein